MSFTDIGEQLLEGLRKKFSVREMDIGADAVLKRKGMRFDVRRYEVEGIGNLCIMDMSAMLGLMKMQTVVLSVDGRDVPLMNLDLVKAMGNRTWIVELYDTRVSSDNTGLLETCQTIKDRDADIEDHVPAKGYWFDSLRYPCSYSKKTKGNSEKADRSCRDYMHAFLEELGRAPVCDRMGKREKIAYFAEGLYKSDGPAVSQMKKLFGEETAKRLVLGHMYGVLE